MCLKNKNSVFQADLIFRKGITKMKKSYKGMSSFQKKKDKNSILLTISLLVSNRIDTIRDCMESLQPILKAIPSELIVVDTGGTDGSIDVAREYTDNIVPFTWCDDFSAARNAGLSKAKGSWFMFLDDDEWFEDPSAIIKFFKSGEYNKYNSAGYYIRNYFNKEGTDYDDVYSCRIARLTENSKFRFKIHETLEPVYVPTKDLVNCYVHHYGYAYASFEESKKHFERNAKPLLEELEKNPEEIRYYVQLIQEYETIRDYKSALEYSRKALALEEEMGDKFDRRYVEWIYASYCRYLAQEESINKAVEEGTRLMKEKNPSELCRAGILYALIIGLKTQKKEEQLLELIKEYHEVAEILEKNPELLLKQQILSMRSYIKEGFRENFYCVGIACACNLKRIDDVIFLSHALLDNRMEVSQEIKNLYESVKLILRDDKDELIHCLAEFDIDDPYFRIQKLLSAEIKSEIRQLKKLLWKCLDKKDGCLPPNEIIFMIALRNEIDVTPWIEKMDEEEWRVCVTAMIRQSDAEERKKLLDLSETVLMPAHRWKAVYFSCVLCETMLQSGVAEENSLVELMRKYSEYIVEYSRKLYRDELFEEEGISYLPKSCRFGLYVTKLFEAYDAKRYREYLKGLKEAVKIYPAMAEPVKEMMNVLKKENEEAEKNKEEFSELGKEIKEKIKYLIDRGQREEALNVIEQLKVLLKDDEDIIRLEKEANL